VSEAVHAQIQQRQVFETRSVGARVLKGIAQPLQVYEVAFAGQLLAPLPAAKMAPRGTGQPYWPRSRAIAMGMTVALVTFGTLVVWNAAQSPGNVGSVPSSFSQEQLTFSGAAGNPRFSPDGRSLAVLQNPGPYGGKLIVMPRDGGGEREVVGDVGSFEWADNERLVWGDAAVGGTFTGTEAEGAQRVSAETWANFAVNPESGAAMRVVTRKKGSAVLEQSLAGLHVDTALTTAGGVRIRQAEWSADGKWLTATVTDVEGRASLRLMSREGSTETVLLPQRVMNPMWGPQGDVVYFASEVDRVTGLHAIMVDLRTGERVGPVHSVLTGLDIEAFDLADDGAIVYTRQQRRANVWTMPVADGATRSVPFA